MDPSRRALCRGLTGRRREGRHDHRSDLPTTREPTLSRKRVLLIDDEEDIRSLVSIALEQFGGWEVRAAADGATGIAIAEEWRPDAILLDAMMPGIDGLATLGLLRERSATERIPILFLTAIAQTADRRALLDAGAAGVLEKPFDPMTLHRIVSQALSWPD